MLFETTDGSIFVEDTVETREQNKEEKDVCLR
jgi:hypothetical protein